MLLKLLLIVSIPLLLGLFFDGNLLSITGIDIDMIDSLLNTCASVFLFVSSLFDHILVPGTMLLLLKFVLLYEFAVIIYRLFHRIITWIQS